MVSWLATLIHLLLALILGGGIVMGSCVRPVLLSSQGEQAAPIRELAAVIDCLRVRTWERFNRLSLLATLFLLPLLVIYAISSARVLSYFPVMLAGLLLAALLRKLAIDRRLQERLLPAKVAGTVPASGGSFLLGGTERRELEIITIAILLLALILIVWPLI